MFERSTTTEVLSDEELLGRTDGAWSAIGRAQRELLELIGEVGRREAWRAHGAHDLAHWVAMRYHLSAWKAYRWVHAAEALSSLPLVGAALDAGRLGIDQVAELTRFAKPETERDLLGWAEQRSAGAIARRADLERRRERAELASVERSRSVRWGYSDDGVRFELEAELPADQGAVVASALDRLVERIPSSPDGLKSPGRSRLAVPMRSWRCVQVRCLPTLRPRGRASSSTPRSRRSWSRWTPRPTPRSSAVRCSRRRRSGAWRAIPGCRSASTMPTARP
jgi:hypothetical protein